jgi:hypothetical protein
MGSAPIAIQDNRRAQLLDAQRKSNILDTRLKYASCPHSLHGIPTGATYEEDTESLENHHGDHHLEGAFHPQVKGWTQLIRQFLQESATAIDNLAHCAHIQIPNT